MDFLNNEGILVMLQTGSKPQRTLHMYRIVNKLLEFSYHPIPEKTRMNENPFYDCEWSRLKQIKVGQNRIEQTDLDQSRLK